MWQFTTVIGAFDGAAARERGREKKDSFRRALLLCQPIKNYYYYGKTLCFAKLQSQGSFVSFFRETKTATRTQHCTKRGSGTLNSKTRSATSCGFSTTFLWLKSRKIGDLLLTEGPVFWDFPRRRTLNPKKSWKLWIRQHDILNVAVNIRQVNLNIEHEV